MKLGASALSFLDAPGIARGAEVTFANGASFVPLVDLGVAPDPATEALGIAFRSEIIFCRLARASPVASSFFCFATSAAASKAVRGTVGAVCSDF